MGERDAAPRTLVTLLQRVAERGARAFLRHGDREWSAAEFAERARWLAGRLHAVGVGRGDRVACWLEKGLDDAVAPFAAAWLGAISVIVNPRLKAPQVRHVCDDSEAAACVTSAGKLLAAGDPGAAFGGRRAVVVDELDGAAADAPEPAVVEPGEPATLLYTSGSTGRPKGIVQSHRSLCDGARIVSGYLGLTAADHVLATLPSSFDYGLNQLLGAAWVGCRVTVHTFFTARELVRRAASVRATGLAGVPELWVGFVDAVQRGVVQREELAALRYVTNSGGRLPARVARFFLAELPHVRVFSMYGLTEAFRSSFVPPEQLAERLGTVGRAMPEVELLIVDPDSGCVVPPGVVGELVHCGACVGDGYWRNPEATAERFRPHPVRGAAGGTCVWSGDLAHMDADGWVTIVGRRDAQLKIGGYRVAPDEVVDVAARCAGVATAAATSVRRGADGIPVLAVALVLDGPQRDARRIAGEVVAACREALPAYLVPGEVHVLGELPLNANHKLDHTALRALLDQRPPEVST
ncbi:MAG: AMP-binding protein [Planctomycetes bacterium]|nr:AMP-binding protein [Planctomycetota bacterium]